MDLVPNQDQRARAAPMSDRDLFGKRPATQPPDALPAGEKRARGAYYTPDALALAICRTLTEDLDDLDIRPRTVFEPGAGGGAFLRAAATTWPAAQILGVDLMPACRGPGEVRKQNLFEVDGRFDLIIGNPDYAIAEKVVRHCLGLLARGGWLAFLLRAAFLGSESRVPLYREFPLRVLQPIAQRPSFTGGGSDPMEYALFVWLRGFKGRGEILPPLVWR